MGLLTSIGARIAHLALAVGLAVLLAMPAAAQDEPSGTSYITPFPEGDIYKLQAYGDAFAEGLLSGLTESFSGDGRVQAARRYRYISGIARQEFEDELKTEEAPGREPVHIAVVMIGVADRISIRVSPRDRLTLGSEEWRAEYGRRVDQLIKTLKRRGIAVYWVGLPIMRRYEVNDPAQMMNDIVREKAYLNGIKFIDITAQFADESGNYSAYGPDVAGKIRLLREADGMLFTWVGYRKLAHFVEQEIKRDLVQARNERTIPLAGAEAEQKRISAQKARSAGEADPAWKGTVNAGKDGRAGQAKGAGGPGSTQPSGAPGGDVPGEQKADNGRITLKTVGAGGREEAVTIDIVRPAIPAAVVALITRKETGERPSQMGDVLPEDVGGGLVVLNSITPTGGPGAVARRGAPSQSAYYQVLIKGERLVPKPGRADDFSWPKVEADIWSVPAPSPAVRRPTAQRVPRS